jgi:DNA repair exonuclease SbcCD ATPase subunit
MTSQKTDMPTLEATLEAAMSNAVEAQNTGSADALDRAGDAILGLVNRAAGTAQADLQEARAAAEELADQLRATRDQLNTALHQINGLKADLRHHQDRADRAEKWLQQISSEIEQKFFGGGDRRSVRRLAPEQQKENDSPEKLAFLRRRPDY